MKKEDLIDQLTKKSQELKSELVQLQEAFNAKKEHFIRVDGALEALSLLDSESESEINVE